MTQTTLRELYEAKDLCEISIGSPPSVAPNSGRVGKNCVVRPVEESPAQSLYRQLTTTTLVVVKLCLSHVAYTAHFSITCMWHGTSHARCSVNVIDEQRCVYKAMQVAEWKVSVAESAHQADTRSVCIICTTVGQHFNWYRVSRGSLGDSWASCSTYCYYFPSQVRCQWP